MSREWKPAKKWNPFNSAKLMAHVDRWSEIKEGKAVPPPALVTIDPTNRCNLNCVWCNAKTVRKNNGEISQQLLSELVSFLAKWNFMERGRRVEAVCVAGGGEPTQAPSFGNMIDYLQLDQLRIGVVTNGTGIDDNQQMLLFCDWVGVSIDAGKAAIYKTGKGKDLFHDVLKQSKRLIDMARGLNRPLNKPGLGNGVFYKFLIHPENISDIFLAACLAKELGFKAIHFRPAGTTWDNLNSDWEIVFSKEMVARINAHLRNAAVLDDDENFSVYGVQHKFTKNLEPMHNFQKCRAVFMTAVFMPPTKPDGGFNMGLCCDRRGDPAMLLLENCREPANILNVWGSERHWEIANSIKPSEHCPRCTYAPHNEIYENVIEQDNMTHVFI